jgi:hypothetical protein
MYITRRSNNSLPISEFWGGNENGVCVDRQTVSLDKSRQKDYVLNDP